MRVTILSLDLLMCVAGVSAVQHAIDAHIRIRRAVRAWVSDIRCRRAKETPPKKPHTNAHAHRYTRHSQTEKIIYLDFTER